MPSSPLATGDIVTALFPAHLPPGHEQQGPRPAVVVGLPELLGPARFPTVFLAPLTSDHGQPWAMRSPTLYPRLAQGAGGLPRSSIVLLDQTRALGLQRLIAYIGSLTAAEFAPITAGLRRVFGS